MRVHVRVIQREPEKEAGHPTSAELPLDRTLYAGSAVAMAPARDWEQVAALEGTINGSYGVRSAVDLSGATHVVVEGEEFEVVAVERRSRFDWVLRARRRP